VFTGFQQAIEQTQSCNARTEAVKESEKSFVSLGQRVRLASLEKSLKLRPYRRELTNDSVAVESFAHVISFGSFFSFFEHRPRKRLH
jgi:hypothetical protein